MGNANCKSCACKAKTADDYDKPEVIQENSCGDEAFSLAIAEDPAGSDVPTDVLEDESPCSKSQHENGDKSSNDDPDLPADCPPDASPREDAEATTKGRWSMFEGQAADLLSPSQAAELTATKHKPKNRVSSFFNPGRHRVSTMAGGVNPDFLAEVPFAKRCLSAEDIRKVALAMRLVHFKEGTTFIKQGDVASDFYIIMTGTVSVWIREENSESSYQVAIFNEGDVFGESALVLGGRRNASLHAESAVTCFSISADKIHEIGLSDKLKPPKRHAVGRDGIGRLQKSGSGSSLHSDHSDKTSESSGYRRSEELVNAALQSNSNLTHLLPIGGNIAKEVLQNSRRTSVAKGENVIIQGDVVADTFFIVESGSFAVTVLEQAKKRSYMQLKRSDSTTGVAKEKRLGTIKSGQSFGELALLYSAPRAATVTALEDSEVLVLDRLSFKEIVRKTAMRKNKEYVRYLDSLPLLRDLTAAERRSLSTALESRHCVKGDAIFSAGDPSQCLYILLDGKVEEVEVVGTKKKKKVMTASYAKKQWKYLGKEALVSTKPYFTTVTVETPTASLLVLDRNAFGMLIESNPGQSSGNWLQSIQYIHSLPVFTIAPDDVKEAVARAVKYLSVAQGDYIYHKGDLADKFYILLEGSLEDNDGKRSKFYESIPSEGIVLHFGDLEIFENRPRNCAVKVVSEKAELLTLDHESFMKLLSPFRDTFSKFWATGGRTILKKDLTMVGVIAEGSFGPIEVCKHTVTGAVYVLKTMRKDLIVKQDMQKPVMREMAVWIQLKSPFIVELHGLYNEPQALHYLFEFVSCGSLVETYHVQGFYGSEEHTRFYIAGVICALRHIQKRRLVHRDIKPDIVLISRTGHPKLCHFGFAKPLIGKTFTTCGTPDYMAPEVLLGTGHNKAVDWWALGIMIFDLMVGRTPFSSDDVMQVYGNVMRGIKKVEFPKACAGHVSHLVHRLCASNPADRLTGVANVMSHPWYAGFDWQLMASQSLEPPYRPLDSRALEKTSVKNHGIPANSKYVDDGSQWDRGFGASGGFLGSSSGVSWTNLKG